MHDGSSVFRTCSKTCDHNLLAATANNIERDKERGKAYLEMLFLSSRGLRYSQGQTAVAWNSFSVVLNRPTRTPEFKVFREAVGGSFLCYGPRLVRTPGKPRAWQSRPQGLPQAGCLSGRACARAAAGETFEHTAPGHSRVVDSMRTGPLTFLCRSQPSPMFCLGYPAFAYKENNRNPGWHRLVPGSEAPSGTLLCNKRLLNINYEPSTMPEDGDHDYRENSKTPSAWQCGGRC